MKTKEYKKGFVDGYEKCLKDSGRIHKEVDELFKPIKKTLEKLRKLR